MPIEPFSIIWNRGVYALLSIAAMAFAIVCFQWSLADIAIYKIDNFLDKEYSRPLSDDNADMWREKRLLMENTLALRSDSVLYYANAERFYQLLDTLESKSPALIQTLGWRGNEQKALDYARLALQIRPSSAFLWKEVVLSDVALKQYGKELNGAIERAVSLDAWNKELLFSMIKLGLDNWDHIDMSAQFSVMLAMEHLIAIDEQQMLLHNGSSKIKSGLILTALTAVKACPVDNQIKAELPKFDNFCNARTPK